MKTIPRLHALLCLSLLLLPAPDIRAAKTPEGYIEIEDGAEEVLRILESLPYATEGSGPVMYTFEFTECGYCQAKYRDFRGQDLGLEFRRFFVPVSDRAARETVALAMSRDSQDYHAYMQRRKVAPAFARNNAAITVHNAFVDAASRKIPPILIRNGWSARGLVYPAYFWIEDGRLFANGGYRKDNFLGAVQRARAGWNEASAAFLAAAGGTPAADGAAATPAPSERPATGPAAPDAPAEIADARPLDDVTVFFLYQKIAGESVDLNAIANQVATVRRAPQLQRPRVFATELARLRTAHDAADPSAIYQLGVRTQVTYQPSHERLDAQLFGPDMFLNFTPFIQGASVIGQPQARAYQRRVVFSNAAAARHLPLPRAQAASFDGPGGFPPVNVVAQVYVRFTEALAHRDDAQKALRAEVVAVHYLPGTGRLTAGWPFTRPVAIDATAATATADVADAATAPPTGFRSDHVDRCW